MKPEAPWSMEGAFGGRDSLFLQDTSMLFKYEVDNSMRRNPIFHPISEDVKDLSLQTILEHTDDILLENDVLAPTSVETERSESVLRRNQPKSADRSLFDEQTLPEVPMVQDVEGSPKNRKIPTLIVDDFETRERFRRHREGQWAVKFDELFMYRKKTGDCLVPHSYKENLPLSQWVKRQRYQYKQFIQGKPSAMTRQRVKALESIGFVWDSHVASWDRRFSELCEFRRAYNHCNVPSNYRNKQLSTWVKSQRTQRKLFFKGKQSYVTAVRIAALESIGFVWEARKTRNR